MRNSALAQTEGLSDIQEQAIEWYVRLSSGTAEADDYLWFERWVQTGPEQQLAWTRLQSMGQIMLEVPRQHGQAKAARQALLSAPNPSRRRLFKQVASLAGVGMVAAISHRAQVWNTAQNWLVADSTTGRGERREFDLQNNHGKLWLNTASAVSFFSAGQYDGVRLLAGEIYIDSAPQSNGRLIVETAEGLLIPDAAAFGVRHWDNVQIDGRITLSVASGTVAVRPGVSAADYDRAVLTMPASAMYVTAGHTASYDQTQVHHISTRNPVSDDWKMGSFSVVDMPLGELVQELGRYQHGWISCDDAVADIRITGTWPFADGDIAHRVLRSLERHFPVQIRRRTQYWTRIEPLLV